MKHQDGTDLGGPKNKVAETDAACRCRDSPASAVGRRGAVLRGAGEASQGVGMRHVRACGACVHRCPPARRACCCLPPGAPCSSAAHQGGKERCGWVCAYICTGLRINMHTHLLGGLGPCHLLSRALHLVLVLDGSIHHLIHSLHARGRYSVRAWACERGKAASTQALVGKGGEGGSPARQLADCCSAPQGSARGWSATTGQ